MGHGKVDALDSGRRRRVTRGVQHAHRHDAGLLAHARGARAVVAHSADDTGDVRPVAVGIHRVVVVVDKIVAVLRIRRSAVPHVGGEVFVRVVGAGIEHRHHDAAAVGDVAPGGLDIHVVARRAGDGRIGAAGDGLSCVLERPRLAVLAVVGRRRGAIEVVGLDVFDVRVITIGRERRLHRLADADPDLRPAGPIRVRKDGVPAGRRTRHAPLGAGCGSELHEHLARHVQRRSRTARRA